MIILIFSYFSYFRYDNSITPLLLTTSLPSPDSIPLSSDSMPPLPDSMPTLPDSMPTLPDSMPPIPMIHTHDNIFIKIMKKLDDLQSK